MATLRIGYRENLEEIWNQEWKVVVLVDPG